MTTSKWAHWSRTLMTVFAGLLLTFSAAEARRRHHRHSAPVKGVPHILVEKYLAADFSGARLQNRQTAATVTEVTWTSEPPWEQVVLVRHFHVGKQKIRRHGAKVSVRFDNLGELKGDVFYPDANVEDVTFGLIRSGGRWKVDRPILIPHISVDAAEKYVGDQIQQAPAGSDKLAALEKTLDQIKALKR